MIGPRVGLVAGGRKGLAVGVGADDVGAGASTTTLTVVLADTADPVITGGDAYAYTAIVQNTGVATATSVSLAITLDASLSYVSSSGTGWSLSVSGQVVTATLATLGSGATANTVTVNVTTGGSALTASTSASVSATNTTAPGTDTETTVVDLVSKDATSGIYVPASSTEWSKFTTRKAISFSPASLYLFQEASGNVVDQIGVASLVASGTGASYQQNVTGWSRKGITTIDARTFALASTDASLPDVSATGALLILYAIVSSAPAASRTVGGLGTTTTAVCNVTATPNLVGKESATTVTGTSNPTGAVRPFVLQHDVANTTGRSVTDQEVLAPTFSAAVTGKKVTVWNASAGTPPGSLLYGVLFTGANAQMTKAQIKSLLQALGWTIPWS